LRDGAQMAIFGDFCVLYLQRAACSTFQTSNRRPLRRGKKKKLKKIEITWQKYNVRTYYIGVNVGT